MVEMEEKAEISILVVDDNTNTLIEFRYNKKYKAQNGENGSGCTLYRKKWRRLIYRCTNRNSSKKC